MYKYIYVSLSVRKSLIYARRCHMHFSFLSTLAKFHRRGFSLSPLRHGGRAFFSLLISRAFTSHLFFGRERCVGHVRDLWFANDRFFHTIPGCRRGGTLYYSVIFPLGPLSFCAAAAAVARREGSVESLFWACCCTALVVGTEKCIIVDSCFFQICSALSGCVVFLPPPQFLKFNPFPST